MGISEKIFVEFTIDKKGMVINPRVVRGQDKYLKHEALRLIKLIPKLNPATQRGSPVLVNYTVPIKFTLQ